MNKQQGFNLVELMIVVAIVGIITAFAYPSYQEQMRKTRRADCAGALASFGSTMERYYTVNNTYGGAGAAGGNTGEPTIFQTTCPLDGGTPTYNLTIQAASVSAFEVRAAPVGVQANDKCGTLTFTNRGLKGITGAAAGMTPDKCW